ncbi:hypothetical protein H0W91_01230 [Patescibacteria group bacterium]|nr:hypothetical protein [Patescibacteria group bacterium]
MKNTIIAVIAVIIIGFIGYFIFRKPVSPVVPTTNTISTTTPTSAVQNTTPVNKEETVIGKSVEGRDIVAYHFGTGVREIVLVGGIHGGYSWNTALVAYQTIDYLKANPSVIPANIKVTVIPALNPDGLFKVVGKTGAFTATDVSASATLQAAARFNANLVDISRNFDCDWQANAKWQSKTVSGGSAAFSEPESLAVKNYVETKNPTAVIVWYSAAGGVYPSKCGGSVMTETTNLTNLFAKASGYKAYSSYNFYETTGDMVNWLAKKQIPAISVLLTNHTDTEFTKNQNGIMAVMKFYTK